MIAILWAEAHYISVTSAGAQGEIQHSVCNSGWVQESAERSYVLTPPVHNTHGGILGINYTSTGERVKVGLRA